MGRGGVERDGEGYLCPGPDWGWGTSDPRFFRRGVPFPFPLRSSPSLPQKGPGIRDQGYPLPSPLIEGQKPETSRYQVHPLSRKGPGTSGQGYPQELTNKVKTLPSLVLRTRAVKQLNANSPGRPDSEDLLHVIIATTMKKFFIHRPTLNQVRLKFVES